MTISTYAELSTAISNWLHRDDLASRIPEFITLAEARIGREVKARQMEQRVSTTPTSEFADLPSDYVSMRALRVQGSTSGWLIYLTPDRFFEQFPSTIATSSAVKYYTIFGDELVFPMTPGVLELWYYKKLPALSSEVNTLFTANQDLYLYGALCAATPFLKDDKRVGLWETYFTNVKNSVNSAHESGRFPAGMAMRSA